MFVNHSAKKDRIMCLEMDKRREAGGGDCDDEEKSIRKLMEMIERVGSSSYTTSFSKTHRKECLNLVRRLKLLLPLLEEIRDSDHHHHLLHSSTLLNSLTNPLLAANKLLKDCISGSKIFLAIESEAVMCRFHGVYDNISQALDHNIPYDDLGVSLEVKEQVELMRMQVKRAKRRADTQDMELAMDMMVVFSKDDAATNADKAILERLANKLELHTIPQLKAEDLAVRRLVLKLKQRGGAANETMHQITDLLTKFKQIAGIQDQVFQPPTNIQRCHSSPIPNEFLCPISLEIMSDPVIVATGQTYERDSILKWFNSNHLTCPNTGQILNHLSLAPNFALRNLILQWSEQNKLQLPSSKDDRSNLGDHPSAEVPSLVNNLSSNHPDVQRDAIMKIRLLSRKNAENRILIASHGGIPLLVHLLSHHNSKQHTVTALLNLSIDETNKRLIAREGGIPAIIDILQNGTDEARVNSAAALFSLSMLDENKVIVGSSNGIPPLVELLRDGTRRGKKDAATALFNLCLDQANKCRAITAGIIPPLLSLLEDKDLGMVDEALSILLLLASHPEGRAEFGHLEFINSLVDIIKNGTPKNKECATSVLLQLGLNNSSLLLAALQFGVYEHLREIASCGTNRAQRKANSLLQHMSKCEHIP